MNELELLSSRVRVLEARFRKAKLLALLACLSLAGLMLMGQARLPQVPMTINQVDELQSLPKATTATRAPLQDELRARQIILVDESGKDRASLVTDGAGSVFLVMFDDAGKTRLNLSVNNDGPSLVFYDPSAEPRTILGSTTLVPSHVNNNGITELAPSSSIVLFDSKGKLLFRTP